MLIFALDLAQGCGSTEYTSKGGLFKFDLI
jgi:hypothetical protein